MWVEFNLRCNNGVWVIFIIKLQWFSVFQCEETDLIYLAWGLQTHKTNLTSAVYRLQPQRRRHLRINKRSVIRLNYFKCQIITQPIVHVSRNILELLYWVATQRDGSERVSWRDTADALLLLFQIQFTQHGLQASYGMSGCFKCYFVRTGRCNRLLLWITKKKKKKKIASRRVTPYTFQESELTRVQGQGWTCQVDGFCFFFCFVFDGADNPNDNGWLCLRAEYSDSCPYFRKRHSQSDFHISPLNVLSLCLKEKYYAHFQVHAFILGHY